MCWYRREAGHANDEGSDDEKPAEPEPAPAPKPEPVKAKKHKPVAKPVPHS